MGQYHYTRSDEECLEEVAGGADDAAEVGAEEQQGNGGRQQVLHDGAVRRRAGGYQPRGRGGEAGQDADQRPAERRAPRRLLLRPSSIHRVMSVSARMEIGQCASANGNHIPRAECGGGEEEGPVAPVVAGRDGRRGGGSRRPQGMTA